MILPLPPEGGGILRPALLRSRGNYNVILDKIPISTILVGEVLEFRLKSIRLRFSSQRGLIVQEVLLILVVQVRGGMIVHAIGSLSIQCGLQLFIFIFTLNPNELD
jgi:hypothetical protein